MAPGPIQPNNPTELIASTRPIKPIQGSWFEFRHHCEPEGKYWNDVCHAFTGAQWAAKIREMAEIGMEYVVLMSVALKGGAFYDTPLLPKRDLACDDPIEHCLRAADGCGIKFFIANDFFHDRADGDKHLLDPAVIRMRFQSMEELIARYGHHASFHGWYYPNEVCIHPHFDDDYIKYAQINSREARRLTPGKKVLIAPYGTRLLRADAEYVRQLANLDVDCVAYQDEVGVQKSRVDELEPFYEQLRLAHDRAGRSALWADVEIFEFEGEVYRSALLPAPFERVKKQLAAVSPYVDVTLVYQYQGMMNKPGSQAFAGHPDSTRLYEDYRGWREKIEN